jgi:hypothetical protein
MMIVCAKYPLCEYYYPITVTGTLLVLLVIPEEELFPDCDE